LPVCRVKAGFNCQGSAFVHRHRQRPEWHAAREGTHCQRPAVSPRGRAPPLKPPPQPAARVHPLQCWGWAGTMAWTLPGRVNTNGVTSNFMCIGRGANWYSRLTYLSSPKRARAYPFPTSVKSHYSCNGPKSADPVCPSPTYASPEASTKEALRSRRVPRKCFGLARGGPDCLSPFQVCQLQPAPTLRSPSLL